MRLCSLFILVMLFCRSAFLYAQEDSTKIENKNDSLRQKSREQLKNYVLSFTNKLKQNDTAYIRKETNFWLQYKVAEYPFNIGEKMALRYIANQIDSITTEQLFEYGNWIEPDFHSCIIKESYFGIAIDEYLQNHKVDLQQVIQQSNLAEEQKDFHLLHLDYFTNYTNQWQHYHKHPEELNKIANLFLSKYPKSIYISYIRKYIRQEYIPSEWASAVYFGSAYNSFTSNLGQKFNNFFDIRIHYELHYKKIFVNSGVDIALGSSVKENINYHNGGLWQQDSPVILMIFPVRIGCYLWDTKHLRLSSFVGGAGIILSPKDKDAKAIPNSRALETTAWAYTTGINIDIKIKEVKDFFYQNYHGFRLTMGYTQPNFWGYATNFDGQIIYFSLGYGGFFRNMKRKK
jgi:hypothetical protein